MRFLFLFFYIFTSLLSLRVDFSHGTTGETVSSEAPYNEDKKNKLNTIKVPFLFSQIQKVLSHEDPTWDDASITRFVTKTIPLSDREYAPDDLVSLSGANIDQAGRSSELRKEAYDALLDMAKAFDNEFHRPIVVVSGYRSAKYQQRLWDLGRCTDTLCAPPGYSEHQLGLAIDIFDATNEDDYLANRAFASYVAWLTEHAHEYGYTQSYQKGEAIDAYEVEPWHWRYIGITLATKLHNLGMSYSEYVEFESMMNFWSKEKTTPPSPSKNISRYDHRPSRLLAGKHR